MQGRNILNLLSTVKQKVKEYFQLIQGFDLLLLKLSKTIYNHIYSVHFVSSSRTCFTRPTFVEIRANSVSENFYNNFTEQVTLLTLYLII